MMPAAVVVDTIPPRSSATPVADRWLPILQSVAPGETVRIDFPLHRSLRIESADARRVARRRGLDFTVARRGQSLYLRRNA